MDTNSWCCGVSVVGTSSEQLSGVCFLAGYTYGVAIGEKYSYSLQYHYLWQAHQCISSYNVLHIVYSGVFRNTPCCTLEIDGESQCFYQRMTQPLSMISVTCTPLTHFLPQSSGVWSHAATATESNNGWLGLGLCMIVPGQVVLGHMHVLCHIGIVISNNGNSSVSSCRHGSFFLE